MWGGGGATNLNVATGCFGSAGFVKFTWGASPTLTGGAYWLDVRVAGGLWPTTGQNVGIPNPLEYTWGGLSGVAPIGGFSPGQAYEWRIWDGTVEVVGPPFTAPVSCSGAGGGTWSLSAGTPTGGQVTFTCGGCPNANVEIFVLGTDGKTVLSQSGTMGSTSTWTWSYGSTPTGTYTANLVAFGTKILATTTVSITSIKNWNDPGKPPPPFNLFDVFQPAKRFGSFGQLASDVLLILVSLAGALAMIFIMISGFKFVTSSGDEKKLASARATLTYAIIGIAVVILAFVIVRILQYFLQSNIPIT